MQKSQSIGFSMQKAKVSAISHFRWKKMEEDQQTTCAQRLRWTENVLTICLSAEATMHLHLALGADGRIENCT
jgi:hypothetical protein